MDKPSTKTQTIVYPAFQWTADRQSMLDEIAAELDKMLAGRSTTGTFTGTFTLTFTRPDRG